MTEIDFTPGYPLDRRSDAMRQRAERGYLGDFEWKAARVVARQTGARVEIRDDNSQPGMVDLLIGSPAMPLGYVEVVTDFAQDYAETVSHVRRRQEIDATQLMRLWWVTVSARATLKTLVADLPELLHAADRAGAHFEIVVVEQHLQSHPLPAIQRLAQLGVVQLASRPLRADETGKILMYVDGTGGPAQLDWTGFGGWLTEFLFAPQLADVRRKLAATGASDRHVFIGATFTSPWSSYHALDGDYHELPPYRPDLPDEITQVWVWSYPHGRCLVWSPTEGWFDTRSRWATE